MDALRYIAATVEPTGKLTEKTVIAAIERLGFKASGYNRWELESPKVLLRIDDRSAGIEAALFLGGSSMQGTLPVTTHEELHTLLKVLRAYVSASAAFRRAHAACLRTVKAVTDTLPGFHYFNPADLL